MYCSCDLSYGRRGGWLSLRAVSKSAYRLRCTGSDTFVGMKPCLAEQGEDVPTEIVPVMAKLVNSTAYKLK